MNLPIEQFEQQVCASLTRKGFPNSGKVRLIGASWCIHVTGLGWRRVQDPQNYTFGGGDL